MNEELQILVGSLIPTIQSKRIQDHETTKKKRFHPIDDHAAAVMAEKNRAVSKSLFIDTITISILGKEWTKEIMAYVPKQKEKLTNLSDEFFDVIGVYVMGDIISDDYYQTLREIFKFFGVAIIETKEGNVPVLYRLDAVTVSENTAGVKLKLTDNKEDDIIVDMRESFFELTDEDRKKRNILLLIREVQQGFVDFRKHSVVLRNKKGATCEEYKIGQDVVVTMQDGNVLDIQSEETKYGLSKDKHGRWQVGYGQNWELAHEFVPIKVSNDDKGITTIKLYGAYTHILRNILNFRPLKWQYKYLMNNLRLNALAGCRRSGKTALISYMVQRQMFRSPYNVKHSSRQIRSIYIAPSEDKFKEVLDYIEQASDKIRILKILKYSKQEKRLSLNREYLGKNNQTIVEQIATCDFKSAKGYEPGRGSAADVVFMDEAGYIPEDVFLNILPILENERADLHSVSTIDWESAKHWFYENLTDWEKSRDEETYSMRVTIDDIDDYLIPQTSKDRMKRALRKNIQRYYAELYATFPDAGAVFPTEGLYIFNIPEEIPIQKACIPYDPAKRSDYGAVLSCEVRGGIMYIVSEHKMQGEYSTGQRETYQAIKGKYSDAGYPTFGILDGTAVGDVVAEIFGRLIDYKVWYTGSSKKPETDKYGSWLVSKSDLVRYAQLLIETRKVRIKSGLTELQEEMKHFKRFKTNSGKYTYEAEKGHDDLVNAFMLACFWFAYLEGGIDFLQKEGSLMDNEIKKLTGINQNTNLFEQFTSRGKKKVKGKSYSF